MIYIYNKVAEDVDATSTYYIKVVMADGNASFVDRDVPFADGNAAARTFGRAHRRRPYHFSYGSVSQGCRRIVRRWTKREKVAGE